MIIAVINNSRKVSNADAALMTQACSTQMSSHIAPAWGRLAVPVIFYPDPKRVPKQATVISIFDSDSDPDILGYHSENKGLPFARVFVNPILDNGGVILYDPQKPLSVSSVLSHEVAELFCDPFVNTWCDGPRLPQGAEYALEVCDPVESDSYVVKVGQQSVWVSNFVYPAWFDAQGAQQRQQFDFLRKVNGPFRVSAGGYLILRSGSGAENLVFGEKYPQWKTETKKHAAARTKRRQSPKA